MERRLLVQFQVSFLVSFPVRTHVLVGDTFPAGDRAGAAHQCVALASMFLSPLISKKNKKMGEKPSSHGTLQLFAWSLSLSPTLENKIVAPAHHIYSESENSPLSPQGSPRRRVPFPQIINRPGYHLARALNSVKNSVSVINKVVCTKEKQCLKEYPNEQIHLTSFPCH